MALLVFVMATVGTGLVFLSNALDSTALALVGAFLIVAATRALVQNLPPAAKDNERERG